MASADGISGCGQGCVILIIIAERELQISGISQGPKVPGNYENPRRGTGVLFPMLVERSFK